MFIDNYKEFLDSISTKMQQLGFDTDSLTVDHIGYQAASLEEFQEKRTELQALGELRHDTQVGEVRVAIVELKTPLEYQGKTFSAIEVVSPRSGQVSTSHWEHVEIVPPVELEEFVEKYPNMNWEKGNMDRDIFPMITLRLDDQTRVKFPRRPVLVETERLKRLETA